MNNILKNTFIFALGAATGSAIAIHILKNKYEQLASEEIESVREYYKQKQEAVEEPSEDIQKIANEAKEKPNIVEYTSKLQQAGYVDYSNFSKPEEEEEKATDEPYVIDPDEYGVFVDYRQVSFTHYANGILTDENDEVVDNVDELVGADYASHFGEYEDDAVHIRNDRLKCDFEILMDRDAYTEE